VKGIQAAFTGKLGQDAEIKTSKAGKPWLSLHVAADDDGEREATTWVRVAVFGQLATRLHPELKKGTEIYCEGRLRLESWVGRDGRERTGLSVAGSRVEVLGRIGFDPYPWGPTEARAPVEQTKFEGQGRTEEDLPF
jgi:single stranded DNA-binding protein